MIRVTCPHCSSQLSAKDELAGQTRKCPKCSQPLQIVADFVAAFDDLEADESLANQHVQPVTEEHLSEPSLPGRLNRESHYLICDKTYVVATWENNGRGWMIRRGTSFVPAKRNRENLPPAGDFQLVELKFAITPEGKRLTGLASYHLATRYAMTTLDQGDDQIVGKITGPGALNRERKSAVRQALRDQYMREVWEGATAVLEYLGNADYHSHSVG